MKSLLLVSRFVSLGLFLHGQEADKTAIIVETISIEEPVPAKSKVVVAKIEPILKSSKKRESSSSKTRKSSKPSHTVVNPPAEFLKKPRGRYLPG